MTVVQCHGTFGLLHYGHVMHLQAAAKLGRLVVTITGDDYCRSTRNKMPQDIRAHMLRALRCVSEVHIIEHADAEPAIATINPDLYVKGTEYRGRLKEAAYCEKHGIRVVYLSPYPFIHTRNLRKMLDAKMA